MRNLSDHKREVRAQAARQRLNAGAGETKGSPAYLQSLEERSEEEEGGVEPGLRVADDEEEGCDEDVEESSADEVPRGEHRAITAGDGVLKPSRRRRVALDTAGKASEGIAPRTQPGYDQSQGDRDDEDKLTELLMGSSGTQYQTQTHIKKSAQQEKISVASKALYQSAPKCIPDQKLQQDRTKADLTAPQKQLMGRTPPKNTLRNYQELPSSDEDRIGSTRYRNNKNSKKLLKSRFKEELKHDRAGEEDDDRASGAVGRGGHLQDQDSSTSTRNNVPFLISSENDEMGPEQIHTDLSDYNQCLLSPGGLSAEPKIGRQSLLSYYASTRDGKSNLQKAGKKDLSAAPERVANSTLAKTRSQQASSAADTGHALVPGGYDTSLTVETNGTRGTQQTEKVHKPAHIKELVERSSTRAFLFGRKRQEEVARQSQLKEEKAPARGLRRRHINKPPLEADHDHEHLESSDSDAGFELQQNRSINGSHERKRSITTTVQDMRYRIRRAASWMNPGALEPVARSAGLRGSSEGMHHGTDTQSHNIIHNRPQLNSLAIQRNLTEKRYAGGTGPPSRLQGVTFLSSSEGGIDIRDMHRSAGSQFLEDQSSEPSLNAANLLDFDQQYTEFGMRDELDIEWEQFRRIVIEYITCLIIWIACIFVEEPDCGIPMRAWVVYYLFFRLFKCVHNGIGSMLVLNDTPIYYKPIAKMLIFTMFEQYEFWWMVYGEYMFFFAPQNKCMMNPSPNTAAGKDGPQEIQKFKYQQLSHNFLFMCMFVLCLFGIFVIINGLLIFEEIVHHYLFLYVNRFQNYNHQVSVLSSVSKFKFRTGFYHGEKECIICWQDFKKKQYVTRLNCHAQHFFHTKCIKDWIKQGNNSCPLCRHRIFDENQQFSTLEGFQHQISGMYEKVRKFVSRDDSSNANTSGADESLSERTLGQRPAPAIRIAPAGASNSQNAASKKQKGDTFLKGSPQDLKDKDAQDSLSHSDVNAFQ